VRASGPFVWAEVDLGAIKRNLGAVRRSIADPRVDVLAVVKADAYGHGMRRVAAALAEEGVRFFGVANLDEALELRRALPSPKILVLGSFHPSQIPAYARARVRPTVSSLEDARAVARSLKRGAKPLAVHVKVDTGMGRLGVWHEEAETLFRSLVRSDRLSVEGIYTHFSNADAENRAFTHRQLERFEKTVSLAEGMGICPRYVHAANSLGVMHYERSLLNLVRPGIVLYGLDPTGTGRPPIRLEPALSLRARISFIKDVGKGRTFSYGATYRVARRTRIATLPVGYSHGYRVAYSNKASVCVRGARCRVAGRVTMDQTLVDVGKARGVRRWDVVTLIGRDGRSKVTASELAALSDTIPYEVVCAIHPRIPRIYKGIPR